MRGSQKSKRVSWASDNLCQVKLFLSDDSPSQVGIGTQDHLQAKALSSGGSVGSDDNLPPGFEGAQLANPWTARLSQIPLIKWKRPLRFQLNIDWQVVAGEESREIEIQNQREMRVLEAIYPRSSAIPPNPCALANVEDPDNNNQRIPVVPITPIEDEDASIDSTSYIAHNTPTPTNTNPMIISQPHHQQQQRRSSHNITPQPNNGHSVEPDIVAAAQAALTSVTGQANNNNNNNNMIDPGLLIKILSDPKMIEQLMSNRNVPVSSSSSSTFHSTPAVGSRNATSSSSPSSSMQHNPPSTSSSPHYIPSQRPPQQQNNQFINRRDPPPSHALAPRPMMPPPGPFYPPRNINIHSPLPPHVPDPIPGPGLSIGAPPVTKDMNYFKSLIQQHGGERRESVPAQFGGRSVASNQENHTNVMMIMKQREMMKPKMMKPCIYFNSPKGCRNGPDCSFQHEIISSVQQRDSEVHSTKRAKLDGEITGL